MHGLEPVTHKVSPWNAPLVSKAGSKAWRLAIKSVDLVVLFFLMLIVLYTLIALLAPVLAPYNAGSQELNDRFQPPLAPQHLFGTDNLGRDILSRLIYGARISLFVGVTAVAISGIFGTTVGLITGYKGGPFDDLINWLVNIQLAFPFVLLAISVVVILGPSLINIILVLAIAGWPSYVRLVRSKVLVLRNAEYVDAARSIGTGELRIVFRHILPNLASALIVLSTLEFARMIIAEAALSFLGLGPGDPDYSSWGLMLAEGKNYLSVAWWVATIPGLTLMTLILAVNIVGDWLRDKLDPQLRGT